LFRATGYVASGRGGRPHRGTACNTGPAGTSFRRATTDTMAAMVERNMAMIGRGAVARPALPRALAFPASAAGLVYIAGFVVLDRVSFIDPYTPFGITPWNPNTGLTFVLVLLFGLRTMPFLFAAPLVADLVNRQLPLPWSVEIASAVVVGGIYGAALALLLRPALRFGSGLSSMRDLLLLIVTAAIASALVATGYVGLMVTAGQMHGADFLAASLRYWVGDVIGIIVVTPIALIGLARPQDLRFSVETVLQIAAIAAALTLVFGFAEEQQFQLFYVLFLPIVWMAVRSGIEGVSIGVVITQFGLIAGLMMLPDETGDVTAFQARTRRRRTCDRAAPHRSGAAAAPGFACPSRPARQHGRACRRGRA
jgi:two-component system, LuxR family, sensor kinase FixL